MDGSSAQFLIQKLIAQTIQREQPLQWNGEFLSSHVSVATLPSGSEIRLVLRDGGSGGPMGQSNFYWDLERRPAGQNEFAPMRVASTGPEQAALEQLKTVVQRQIDDRVVNKERQREQTATGVDQEIMGL